MPRVPTLPRRSRRGALALVAISVLAASPAARAQDIGLDYDAFKDYLRQRKFIRAIAGGHVRRAEKLLERGADLYANPIGDDPPMMVAVASGHPEVVALLADAGAAVGPRWRRDKSPLRLAFVTDQPEIGEVLLAKGAPAEEELLLDALRRGRTAWTDLLTRHGARAGPRRVVDLLRTELAARAPAEGDELAERALSVLFLTPGWESEGAALFFLTACRDSPDAARRLIEKGISIDSLDPLRKKTPLLAALYRGDEACVDRLVAWGADAGVRKATMTPLARAVGALRIDVARRLLELGADADGADERGRTPLMALADVPRAGGDAEKVRRREEVMTTAAALLLGAGARVGRRDVSGRGALDLAATHCHRSLFGMLLEAALAEGWSPSQELWSWSAAASDHCGGPGWLAFLDSLRGELHLDFPDAVQLIARPRSSLPPDRQAQLRTLEEIHRFGRALMVWFVEEVGGAALPVFRPDDFAPVSFDKVADLLAPHLAALLPETDGWGRPLEFRFNLEGSLSSRRVMIRSPGRDGLFADPYEFGAFPWQDYDQDIVWVDGRFVRWPGTFF